MKFNFSKRWIEKAMMDEEESLSVGAGMFPGWDFLIKVALINQLKRIQEGKTKEKEDKPV